MALEPQSVKADVELLSGDEISPESETLVDPDVELLEEGIDPETGLTEEAEEEITEEEPEVEVEDKKIEEVKDDKFNLSRPTVTDINKAFPDFFKKFPDIKNMMFREKEFTMLFPTVEIAKDAAEAAEALSDFRGDLFEGTGEKFTKALDEAGELDKFSTNFLTNLQKSNKDAYWNAVTPTLQNMVRAVWREGVKRNDDNLKLSAENVSIYLFDTAEVAQGKKSAIVEKQPEDPKIKAERADMQREKFNTFRIDVLQECNKGAASQLDLDKFKQLTPKMKTILAREIITEVDNTIAKDEAHMKFVNSLWKRTQQSGYTNEIKSRIISAYLERAKSLVPSIRRRLLTEALGNTPSEAKRKLEVSERAQSRREPGSGGRPANGGRVSVPSAKSVNWDKTTDMDFLNDNTTLKGRK